jgi:hypothetical protein
MEPTTDWLEYRLVTTQLDPPVFRCRLKPIDMFNMIDGFMAGESSKMGQATIEAVVEAIVDWDLSLEGTPIPLTPENKMAWLRPIIAEQVEGKDAGILLGIAILMDGRNRENFLKK